MERQDLHGVVFPLHLPVCVLPKRHGPFLVRNAFQSSWTTSQYSSIPGYPLPCEMWNGTLGVRPGASVNSP